PSDLYDFDPRIETRVVLAMSVLLVAIVAAAALLPAIVSVNRSVDLVPRRGRASGVRGHRAAMVVQVALSVILLAATAELLTAFATLARIAGAARANTL